jgi:hypothetical protein
MLTDAESVRRLRDLILDGDDGAYMTSQFVHLEAAASIQVHMGQAHLGALSGHLRGVRSRLVDLEVICSKLEWMRHQRNAGSLDRFAWMYYASNDVVGFLSHARSLLDHLALAIGAGSHKPGQVPSKSFRQLKKWVADGPTRAQSCLGPEMVGALSDTDWFWTLRALRDGLIHFDHKAIVFPGEEGNAISRINMQIWTSGYRNGLSEEALLEPGKDNLAVFERLATAVLARVHDLLERLAGPLGQVVAFDASPMQPQARHGGLRIVRSWASDFLAEQFDDLEGSGEPGSSGPP